MHPAAATAGAVLLFSAAAVTAQGNPSVVPVPRLDAPPQPARVAQRLVRALELPARCTEAWRGLVELGPEAALPLATALRDPRPEVAVRAAWVLGLLRQGGEAALPELRAHVDATDPKVAHACRWAIARIEFRGRLLVDYQRSTVEHLGDDGRSVRKVETLKNPWHAEPVADGNWMVSEYGGGCVREIDPAGKEVWKHGGLNNPYHAMRLPDGNTLISDAGNDRVVEVDRAGNEVAVLTGLKRPVAAVRTPDGHTLVSEQNGTAVEFDAAGKRIWECDAAKPQHAERLPDGTTLLALHHESKVLIVDGHGRPIGKPIEAPQAQAAMRRRDGHLLIASTSAWFELDATGKEVWRQQGSYAVGVFW